MKITGTRVGINTGNYLRASTTATIDGDLDLIAIELAMNGTPVALTAAEKIYAARLLDEHGFDATAIGQRIGSAPATVTNWKARGWPMPAPEVPPIELPDRATHGRKGYKLGCRCRTCKDAVMADQRAYRARKATARTAAAA